MDKFSCSHFSCAEIPLKIPFTKNKNKRKPQATDQPAFELDYYGNHHFSVIRFGIPIEFMPAEGKFKLKQGGKECLFEKK